MADKTDKKDTAKTASIFWPTLTAPSKIDSIELDIVIEREHKLESEVTEHPVEDGFPVHDHVIRKPIKLSMVVGITQSPVTWLDLLGQKEDKVKKALAEFKRIYKEAQPITIVTPDEVYKDMVMTSAAFPRTVENKNMIRIPCEFTQIRKVAVKTTDVPENLVSEDEQDRAGETERDGGTSSQTESSTATTTKRKSILKGFLN